MTPIRNFAGLILLVILLSHFATAQNEEPVKLEQGKPVEQELKGGESRNFELLLANDQFVHLVADQKGIDVVVALFAPDGTKLQQVDSPNGTNGDEPLWFVSETPGKYRLEVRSLTSRAPIGRYQLRIEELRRAEPAEKLLAGISKAFTEALVLANDQKTIEAVHKYQEAIRSLRKAADLKDRSNPGNAASWKHSLLQSLEPEIAKSVVALKTKDQRLLLINSIGDVDVGSLVHSLAEQANSLRLDYRDSAGSVEILLIGKELSGRISDPDQKKRAILSLARALRKSGDFASALNAAKTVLSLAEQTNDPRSRANAFVEIGQDYWWLGDYQKAVQAGKQAVEYAEKNASKELLIASLLNLGAYLDDSGDYSSTLQTLSKALRILEEATQENPDLLRSPVRGALYKNIGALYGRLGNTPLALKYFQSSQEASRLIGRVDPGILLNIGNVYLIDGNFEAALELYKQAYEQFDKTDTKRNTASALGNIGDAYRALGKYDLALETHLKALKIKTEAGSPTLYLAEWNVAQDQFLLGDYVPALIAAKRIAKESKLSNPDGGMIKAFVLAGKILHRNKNYDESSKYFEEAVSIIEKVRRRMLESDSSFSDFFDRKDSPYPQLVKLRTDQKQFPDALFYAESGKSRRLLDLISSGKRPIDSFINEEDRSKQSALKAELVTLRLQLARESRLPSPDPSRISILQSNLQSKRLEFQDFTNQLYVSYPRLRTQRAQFEAVDFRSASEMVTNSNQAVAEFAVTDDRTIVFLINRDRENRATISAFPVSIKESALSTKIESLRSKLASGDLSFHTASRELYDLLIKPVEKELAGKTNIIIVPDGPLWDLPFQALLDSNGKYLIEKAAVSYAPSLTALREMSKRAKARSASTKYELVAFGNPTVGKETAERVQRVFMDEKLEPLPEAERLVTELGKLYGKDRSSIYVEGEAKESVAKSEIPKYRIVQFATHGILNNISPMYSHLVMAQNTKDPNEDGLLEAWELKDLDLNADLVILSACDTARGKISGGEGVIGMSWAAFIAGAPSIVASQWKVESSSTTELMLEFHRQLLSKKHPSKAEALRQASLKLMHSKKYSHPSYWAGFIVVGDGN